MTGPLVLGFDTSAAHCAAALLMDGEVLAAAAETMERGQAERLMPMLEGLLAGAGCGWSDLAALGVGIGPGNFTGIRIAVAAARGLALALRIPAVGVSGFEARALGMGDLPVIIPAPRGMVYLRRSAGAPPEILPAAELPPGEHLSLRDLPLPAMATAIARIAAARYSEPGLLRPAPLYLRPADAAPMRDAPPQILS